VAAEVADRGEAAVRLHEQQLHAAQPRIKAALEGGDVPAGSKTRQCQDAA